MNILFIFAFATYPKKIFLIANNPKMLYNNVKSPSNGDMIVRFNTCTPPTDKLFAGITHRLYLRINKDGKINKGNHKYGWHGVNENCILNCRHVIQNTTEIFKIGGNDKCEKKWNNKVVSRNYNLISYEITSAVSGLQSGTAVAIQYYYTYPKSHIYLVGFTFHNELHNDSTYGHDPLSEIKIMRKYNITAIM